MDAASSRPPSDARALSPTSSALLDVLRAGAAILVFVGHVRAVFFVDARDAGLGPVGRAGYYATGFGHQAVMFFFVLSGFLVGGSYLRARTRAGATLAYFIARASRLYAVLIPAIALTLFWDTLGARLFGVDGNVYGGDFHGAALGLGRPRTDPATILGNVLFLQNGPVPYVGTNGPLWSLSYEAWFYLVFPCLFTMLRRDASWLYRLLALVVSVTPFVLFGGFSYYFGIWGMGVIAAFAFQRTKISCHPALLLGWCPALVSLHVSRVHPGTWVGSDIMLGGSVTIGVFLVSIARLPGGASRGWASAARWLAGMSFTLYCVHFPLVAFFQAMLSSALRFSPRPKQVAIACGLSLLVFSYAWLVSRLTEANTDKVRSALRGLLRS